MPSQSIRNWRNVSRNLMIVASMAERFLELSPEERLSVLQSPDSDYLRAYSGLQLADTIRQAKDIVRMLESAEEAWKQANKKSPKVLEKQAS